MASSNLLILYRCTKSGSSKTQMLTEWYPPRQKALIIPFKVPERLLPSFCSTQRQLVNSYRFLQLHSVWTVFPGGLCIKNSKCFKSSVGI